MEKQLECLELKRKVLSDLEAELLVAPITITNEDPVRCRSQIQRLKKLWRDFSGACASLKAIYVLTGESSRVYRLKNEKKAISARVGTAVCDLNDFLKKSGMDLESNFADSSVSSLSGSLFEDAVIGSNLGGAEDPNLETGGINTSENLSTPLAQRSLSCRMNPSRNVLPPEEILQRRLWSADREFKRWLIAAETAGTLPSTVSSLYCQELNAAFNKLKNILHDLELFYKRRGEMLNQRKTRDLLRESIMKCDRASEILRSKTDPLVSESGDTRRVHFDSAVDTVGKEEGVNYGGQDVGFGDSSLKIDLDFSGFTGGSPNDSSTAFVVTTALKPTSTVLSSVPGELHYSVQNTGFGYSPPEVNCGFTGGTVGISTENSFPFVEVTSLKSTSTGVSSVPGELFEGSGQLGNRSELKGCSPPPQGIHAINSTSVYQNGQPELANSTYRDFETRKVLNFGTPSSVPGEYGLSTWGLTDLVTTKNSVLVTRKSAGYMGGYYSGVDSTLGSLVLERKSGIPPLNGPHQLNIKKSSETNVVYSGLSGSCVSSTIQHDNFGNSFQSVQAPGFRCSTAATNNERRPTRLASSPMGEFYSPSYRSDANDLLAASFLFQSKLQLRQELRKGMGIPFDGRPEIYRSWRNRLMEDLEGAECTPSLTMDILRANTTGAPLKIVDLLYYSELREEDKVEQVWRRFEAHYGSHTTVFRSYLDRLHAFPKISSPQNVDKMYDLLAFAKSLAASSLQSAGLKFLRSSEGLSIIWEKMPDPFIERWRTRSGDLKRGGRESSIQDLIDFMSKYIEDRNNPDFRLTKSRFETVLRTNVEDDVDVASTNGCSVHNSKNHRTSQCKEFLKMSPRRRRNLAFKEKLCYLCLEPHFARSCPNPSSCEICNGTHHSLLHKPSSDEGGNREGRAMDLRSHCTVLYRKSHLQSPCFSKTLPVQVRAHGKKGFLTCYCVLDEQSTSSFCDPKVVEILKAETRPGSYRLSTMTGFKTLMEAQSVEGLEVRGVGEEHWIQLPRVWTHSSLPDTRAEVATREVVSRQAHIRHLAYHFPQEKLEAEVLLLVGVNCGEAMRTKLYGNTYPFAHHTALGWSLVGPVDHSQESHDHRCLQAGAICEHFEAEVAPLMFPKPPTVPLTFDTFTEDHHDELLDMSRDDRAFLNIVAEGVHINKCGNLELPLPLKQNATFTDNRNAVYARTRNCLQRICKKPELAKKCMDAMSKYLKAGHISEVGKEKCRSEHGENYIPIVAVEHPMKGKVRIAFDSTASFLGRSLNENLLRGPDVTNLLLGVLIRFREGKLGFAADVESMFHCFHVNPEHRDLLRFFWWKGNIPGESLSTYKANVHIFGNRSSPAIATFALRHAVSLFGSESSREACAFIRHNFYVDDGLAGANSAEDGIKVLRDARDILARVNVRLHKIVSSCPKVLEAFPSSELGADLNHRDICAGAAQAALGLSWDIKKDTLSLKLNACERPFTKRGILSVINSIYDPLGWVSPIVLQGRLLQRKIIPQKNSESDYHKYGWDDVLPSHLQRSWEEWTQNLGRLSEISIPRPYSAINFNNNTELHMFADASAEAIGYVSYLRRVGQGGTVSVAYLLANSKVAPRAAMLAATSIPRLELCAAVEAAQATRFLISELRLQELKVFVYVDSSVVLGYIHNSSKRFSRYVASRIGVLLKNVPLDHWGYVPGKLNPADKASRPQTVADLLHSTWFTGPDFLHQVEVPKFIFALSPSTLPETIPTQKSLRVTEEKGEIFTPLFRKNFRWSSVRNIVSYIWLTILKMKKEAVDWGIATRKAEASLLRNAQEAEFAFERRMLTAGRTIPDKSVISRYSPFLDEEKVLRVGGRLSNINLPFGEKHPVLLPQDHPLTILLLNFYHERCFHQGRILTTASLRHGGFHIHRQKSVVGKFLNGCFICRKLRGTSVQQKMSDLPMDRLEKIPPFLHSGVDVFGPYYVHDGRTTRRTTATKKIWVILFNCLYSRAIHVDSLKAMDVPTFQLALRRFVALRGTCTLYRSDCGSNFVGLHNQTSGNLDIEKIVADANKEVVDLETSCWKFSPPRASHFNGVWERKIGAIKRVLESSLRLLRHSSLSRDEFCTLLQEAAAIVNSTPLGEISGNPEDPFPVSPACLLNLREKESMVQSPKFTEEDMISYGSKRWRRVQYLAQQFWLRWRDDYLKSLSIRRKWLKPKGNLKEGDVVLLKDDCSRSTWPLGVITEAKLEKDKLVRRVLIRKGDRVFSRAASDVVFLVRPDN